MAYMTGFVDQQIRPELLNLITTIDPHDSMERDHCAETVTWISSGAPLYRIAKPDVPPKHLVSYFVILDNATDDILLGAHRKAGLWLPSGGHVEPGESPWQTVERECWEELHLDAIPEKVCGTKPFFLTITETRGHQSHTDVSLWHVLRANRADVTYYDEQEYTAINWLSRHQILQENAEIFDPHMRRFIDKLLAKSVISY